MKCRYEIDSNCGCSSSLSNGCKCIKPCVFFERPDNKLCKYAAIGGNDVWCNNNSSIPGMLCKEPCELFELPDKHWYVHAMSNICHECCIEDVCKHNKELIIPHYDHTVFDIEIKCKIREKLERD